MPYGRGPQTPRGPCPSCCNCVLLVWPRQSSEQRDAAGRVALAAPTCGIAAEPTGSSQLWEAGSEPREGHISVLYTA